MKICTTCGQSVQDIDTQCPRCGSTQLVSDKTLQNQQNRQRTGQPPVAGARPMQAPAGYRNPNAIPQRSGSRPGTAPGAAAPGMSRPIGGTPQQQRQLVNVQNGPQNNPQPTNSQNQFGAQQVNQPNQLNNGQQPMNQPFQNPNQMSQPDQSNSGQPMSQPINQPMNQPFQNPNQMSQPAQFNNGQQPMNQPFQNQSPINQPGPFNNGQNQQFGEFGMAD